MADGYGEMIYQKLDAKERLERCGGEGLGMGGEVEFFFF